MILTCPECTTRYRFDESRIPEAGVPVRCKRCRVVFRAYRSQQAAPEPHAPLPVTESDLSRAADSARPSRAPRPSEAPASAPPTARGDAGGRSALTAASSAPPAGGGSIRVEKEPDADLARPSGPSAAVSVTIVPPAAPEPDNDIRRLTRIILSDIVIYSPDRADQAIRDGRFPEVYKAEIDEGRRMIRSRFPGTSEALQTYERSLQDLLEARRKELQEAPQVL